MNIQINTAASVNLTLVGQNQIPVIHIDDFLLSTAPLIAHATQHVNFYLEKKSSYPGLRAKVPSWFLESLVPLIAHPIREIYQLPEQWQPHVARSDFSLATFPPNILTPRQKIPHADSNRSGDFAMVFYVNEGQFGGTSFYRHNVTGTEFLFRENEEKYWNAVSTILGDYENPDIGYINGSDAHYERIGGLAYKPNRLVIYPTSLLHSGDLTEQCINDDPAVGRLTMNVMLVFA